MAARHQKRVLRYVEGGSLLKLKSYLRKHPVDLNYCEGRKRRGPLHLACSLGDDAVLRLLLKNGADPLQKDRHGDTPLHLAAKKALKRGKRAYDDLVVPLQKNCPVAMETPNKAGVTPRDLLQWMREDQFQEPTVDACSSSAVDPERAWRDKLLGECQDEFYETFGQYDEDFLHDDVDSEDFADWAERIRREYAAKQRAWAQRAAAAAGAADGKRRRKTKEELEEEAQSRRELQRRLQREHEEYLERAARKQAETRSSRKQQYEEKCAAAFGRESSSRLGYADIPWPAPRGSVEEMVEVMLHGSNRADLPAFRKLLRRQQALWHPDKFLQRCGDRLAEGERKHILDTVTALSQELNRLAQSVR